jgi:DNA-binding response OmpR family regulator
MANILIVDDDEQTCDLVATVFHLAGHDTRAAYNGQAAIDEITVNQPDFVLLDLEMPVMDGWQVLKWVRAKHTADELPIIVYSAVSDEKMLALAMELGANECWQKGQFCVEEMPNRIVPFVARSATRAA